MRRLLIPLAAAATLLACRPSHAAVPHAAPPTGPFPEATVQVWNNGLGEGWLDYGWAPRQLTAGAPASLDLASYGGWIIAHPGLLGRYGGVRIRYRAPASFGEFIEVRLDAPSAQSYPRVMLDSGHQRATADGWTDAFVSMAELDPKGFPFDRVVLHATRELGHDKVEVALIGLTAPGAGSPVPAPALASIDNVARPVKISVDCRAATHAINPMIYGIAYAVGHDASGPEPWSLGATARRWGGNPASRYNWKLGNAWNTASDWFFQNVNYTGIPGYTYQRFLDDDAKHNLSTALTVPTLGWVAKDTTSYGFPVTTFGPQQQTAPEQTNAGNGLTSSGKKITPGPPTQTSIAAPPEFMGEWVKTIREHDGKGKRSVQEYILDNEPALWNSTHRDVHPAALGYDELLDRTISYAKAIKQADPEAIIAGPAEWGWPAYQYSAIDSEIGFTLSPDRRRHGNVPLIPWWLGKLREYKQKTGVNLVDILDVHFYPQANGVGIGTGGGTDTETNALRLRQTRGLWDPTYVDESWIKTPIMLLPRLKKWIEENDPGLGISIGEWNFGAEQDMSGGLAVAEALGRFGQAGITSAFYWTYPAEGSPAFWGFRAFRNYDGKGAHFLDTAVTTTSSDVRISAFTSRNAEGQLVTVLLNLDPDTEFGADVSLQGCGVETHARSFAYTGGSTGFQAGSAALQGAAVHESLQPYSMTVVELSPK